MPQATLSYIDTNVFGVDWLATAVGQMGINVLIDNRPVIGAPFFVDVQPGIMQFFPRARSKPLMNPFRAWFGSVSCACILPLFTMLLGACTCA